ncbi:MAG: T9SS type A sorting domain-containing protein [Ignavibacteriales bacterium]|nr:T9SS type A sorting domain-containing protein [Ignavibacteriales bacterium]
MKRLHYRSAVPLFMVFILLSVHHLSAWGLEGHRAVNKYGIRTLPLSFQRFKDIDYYFADHASDVDRRKITDEEETYRQFIELERYPEFFNGAMPRTLLELQKKYSESSVQQNGYLPYLVYLMYDSVTNTMRRRDWNATLTAVSDLGHYIGDLTMPLNTTMNYDGQLTKNNGIKWRYEIELMNRYYHQLDFRRIEAKKLDDPMIDIFKLLERSHTLVPSILQADNAALKSAKGKYNGSYYSAFWKEISKQTNDVVQEGSVLFANLLFTAWLNAGGVKVIWRDEMGARGGLYKDEKEPEHLEQNFPNPFNPKTTITYIVPGDFFVRLAVFNLFGQEVVLLHEGRQSEGKYECLFNGEHLPGGIYFVRLQLNEKTETRKMILAK